jgi:hypothetical protein
MTPTGSTGSPGRGARLLVLSSWLALLVGLNLLTIRGSVLAAPPPWDPALYLFMSLRYWHLLTEQGLRALWREIQDPWLVPHVAPLFPLSALPLYSLFGESRLVAYATSSLFLCAMLVGTYLLARERHGPGAGFLALFLASTFAAPINLSRDYQMDLPATALLCLAVWSLSRSSGFRGTGASLAFGGLAGLALVTKTMSAPFFVAPALRALLQSWRRAETRRALRNAGIALAAAALLASAWWWAHAASALSYLLHYGMGRGADPYVPPGLGDVLTLGSLTYYLAALANHGASVPYFLLMGLLVLAWARRRLRGGGAAAGDPVSGLLWAWLLAGYLLLTLSRNKTADRYVVFLVPPVAVLMAGALARLPRGGWRRVALSAALLMGLENYVALTWPGAGFPLLAWRPPLVLTPSRPRQAWLRTETQVPETGWPLPAIVETLWRSAGATKARLLPVLLAETPRGDPPEEQVRAAYRRLLRRQADPLGLDTYSRELRNGTRSSAQLLEALAASDEFAARPLRVLVVPDHPFANASTLRYYAEVARAHVAFDGVDPVQLPPLPLEEFDALVVKDGGYQGPAFSTRHVPWVEARLRTGGAPFEQPPTAFPCPDGSSLLVFVAAGPPAS